jgi:hypothetical protein
MSYFREVYGPKHFFGHIEPSEDVLKNVLTIALVRNPLDWMNSLYRNPWHLERRSRDPKRFLEEEVHSYQYSDGSEILKDRSIDDPEKPYANLLDLRYTKIKYMKHLEENGTNVLFVRYEDIRDNYQAFLQNIKEHYKVETRENYPSNITFYKDQPGVPYDPNAKKRKVYTKDDIVTHPSYQVDLEKHLGYDL